MGDAPPPFFINSQPSAPPDGNQNTKPGPIIGWNPKLLRKPPQQRLQSYDAAPTIVTTKPLLKQQRDEHVSRTALQQHVSANSKIYIRICIAFACLLVLIVLAIIITLFSGKKANSYSLPERAFTTPQFDW